MVSPAAAAVIASLFAATIAVSKALPDWAALAVAAFPVHEPELPDTDPVIAEVNVFCPAIVWLSSKSTTLDAWFEITVNPSPSVSNENEAGLVVTAYALPFSITPS